MLELGNFVFDSIDVELENFEVLISFGIGFGMVEGCGGRLDLRLRLVGYYGERWGGDCVWWR